MPNTQRILVVDDHKASLEGMFLLLMHAGFSVLTAESGQQALDLLDRGLHPRMIILDLMMSHVSGWDVLKYLQSDPSLRDIPVIVTTGADAGDRPVVAADLVLRKPLDPDEVVAATRRLLAGSDGPLPS